MSLRSPPSDFDKRKLPFVHVDASELVRISSFETGEPWFGKSRTNRFDDRRRRKKDDRFGTCYAAFTLECAFAETVLHNRVARGGKFKIPPEDLVRWVVTFNPEQLTVAVLLGGHLKKLGGDGEISTIADYSIPGRWAATVHEHPFHVDGIMYVSKHVNDQNAVVIFDRAKSKLRLKDSVKFEDYVGSQSVIDFFTNE